MLRDLGLRVRVLIGVIDLVMARARLRRRGTTACAGLTAPATWFGPTTRALSLVGGSPLVDFNRITRALIFAVSSCIQREKAGKARAAWAALLETDPSAKGRIENALANTVTRQMSGYRRARAAIVAERVVKLEGCGAAPPPDSREGPEWPWAGVDRDSDLTHAAPLRELPPTMPLASSMITRPEPSRWMTAVRPRSCANACVSLPLLLALRSPRNRASRTLVVRRSGQKEGVG
jgi:hypothetical protein